MEGKCIVQICRFLYWSFIMWKDEICMQFFIWVPVYFAFSSTGVLEFSSFLWHLRKDAMGSGWENRQLTLVCEISIFNGLLWLYYAFLDECHCLDLFICHCVDQPMLCMYTALFFIRDDSFTDSIADETVRKQFIDELQPIASKKLKMLKTEDRREISGNNK